MPSVQFPGLQLKQRVLEVGTPSGGLPTPVSLTVMREHLSRSPLSVLFYESFPETQNFLRFSKHPIPYVKSKLD